MCQWLTSSLLLLSVVHSLFDWPTRLRLPVPIPLVVGKESFMPFILVGEEPLAASSSSPADEEVNSSGSEMENGSRSGVLSPQSQTPITTTPAPDLQDTEFSKGKTHFEQMIHFLHHGVDRDVKFVFTKEDNSVLMAHKTMLSARSPYLAELLIKESKMELPVQDATLEDFKLFLEHLYAGHPVVDVKDAYPLLQLATTYTVPDIKAQCSELLMKGITDENAMLILNLSGKYGDLSLHKKALDYITKNATRFASGIAFRSDFSSLRKDDLKGIIGSDELDGLGELRAYLAILRWGRKEMKRQGIPENEEGMRSVLEDVIQLIRFPLMTKNEFYVHVLQGDMRILTVAEKEEMRDYFEVNETDRGMIKLRIFNQKARSRPVQFPAAGDAKDNIKSPGGFLFDPSTLPEIGVVQQPELFSASPGVQGRPQRFSNWQTRRK